MTGAALAERLVARATAQPLVRARQIVGAGEVNAVYSVVGPERTVVARLNDTSELARLQVEAWCIDAAAAAGVPGAEVLEVGDCEGHAYMLQSFICGQTADRLPAPATIDVWQRLGGHLRRIHGVAVGGFGEKLVDMAGGGDPSGWRRYVHYNLEELHADDPLLALGALNREDQNALRGTFELLLCAPLRFGLSHGDMSLDNAIAGDDGQVHVIDWGCAHAHVVPHYDFGVILRDSLQERSPQFSALLAGYGMSTREYMQLRPAIRALSLLVATDKVRWALDRSPDRLPAHTRTLQRQLAQD